MHWTKDLADPRWAGIWALVVLAGLFGLAQVEAHGELGAGSGWGYGANDERVVAGMKAVVPVGAIIHIDLREPHLLRCGTLDSGVSLCKGGPAGDHPADGTARFYVTEPGDGLRLLNGQPPLNVLYERDFADAVAGEIRVERPAPSTEPRVGGADYHFRWRAQETDVRMVEVFWVLENRSGAHFHAAENDSSSPSDWESDPVFDVDNLREFWLTTGWHATARNLALAVVAVAGCLALLSVGLWVRALLRRRPSAKGTGVEAHLDAVHGELVRLDRLVTSVVVAGGLLLLVGVAAAIATWTVLRPDFTGAGRHGWWNEAEAVGQLALTVLASVAVVTWAAVVWDIRRRYRHVVAYLGTQPEIL